MSKTIIISIAALALVLFIGWVVPAEELHHEYDVNNIDKMNLWGMGLEEGLDGRSATEVEKKQIITWLNEAEDVMVQQTNPTTSAKAGIDIVFTSGEGMIVFPLGEFLLVQRYTEIGWESSYLKQENLAEMLRNMSKFDNKS